PPRVCSPGGLFRPGRAGPHALLTTCGSLFGCHHRIALGLREALACSVEPGLAPVGQCLSSFPERQGLLQGGGTAFEFTDYFHELVAGLFIAERSDVGGLGIHAAHPITSWLSCSGGGVPRVLVRR